MSPRIAESAESELPSPSGSREVDDSIGIDTLLRRLCRFNSLISVRRAGDEDSHATTVLLVQHMLRRVVIDTLPESLSVPGTLLHLRTRFDGAELNFNSTVIGRLLHDGAPALAIAIPTGIRLHERRVTRRLPVPAASKLPASTARLDQTHFRFEVADVSVLGAGGTAHDAPVLMVGDKLELLIELPGSSVPVQAEVRTRSGSGRTLRLGLRFTDLRPHHLDRLSAALLRLERRELRNHHSR
ncbi:flagellar brake protein [Solimonas terrae]|uniref:Flagellar brake protein n=1 Tax=Solimonas terrae TaxID=1396819 RepID=A0A6M2BPJ2_9GAMM|nr:flagellar brake protein [Solimonas terrae]NGY04398.1 flagellar brake protein [Solimonas terrae]